MNALGIHHGNHSKVSNLALFTHQVHTATFIIIHENILHRNTSSKGKVIHIIIQLTKKFYHNKVSINIYEYKL